MKCHILTFGKRSEKMNRESTTASKINQKHTQLTLKSGPPNTGGPPLPR